MKQGDVADRGRLPGGPRQTAIMEPEARSLQERIEELAGQVRELRRRVDELASGQVPAAPARRRPAAAPPAPAPSADASEDILTWAGASALLPRISSLCFLLVVALALRTVTDSGMVDTQIGSWLGMVYAAGLMAAGWFQYGRSGALAPVFTITGAVLMLVIVVETHSRFGSLPTVPAYALLIGTGLAMAATSHVRRTVLPTVVGTLGMCVAGVAINVPDTSFPLLALLLLVANLIGFFASKLQRRNWLRWTLLFFSAGVLQVWGLKLEVLFRQPGVPLPPLAPGWFLPAVAAFAALYFFGSIVGVTRRDEGKTPALDYLLPTINVLVAYSAADYVVSASWGSAAWLGILGIVLAICHVAVAAWIVRGMKTHEPALSAFVVAGVVLLGFSLPAAAGSTLAALPFLSGAAFALARLSKSWESGGVRVVSYLVQIYSALALAVVMILSRQEALSVGAGAAAGALAVFALLHHRWCRRQSPPACSLIFAKFDMKDYCAVSLFLASLVGFFFLLRLGLYQTLLFLPGDVGNAFSGAQSVLINLSAAILLLVAVLRRNREVRNVAILVTLAGGAKVFMYDLVGTHGLPRLFSVFSFGLVAAAASILLSRWQRLESSGEIGRDRPSARGG